MRNAESTFDTDSRGDRLKADNFRMLGAQVFFRHGARTPVYNLSYPKGLLKEIDWDSPSMLATPEYVDIPFCVCYLDGKALDDQAVTTEKVMEKKANLSQVKFRKGSLTYKGQEEMYNLGKTLRDRYITKFKLLDSEFDPKQMYCRSTNFDRNISSARSLLSGFISKEDYEKLGDGVKIHVSKVEEEILLSNRTKCPFLKLPVTLTATSPEKLTKLREKFLRFMGEEALTITENGDSMVILLLLAFDNLVARQYHGEEFCEELEDLVSEMRQLCPLEMTISVLGEENTWPVGFRRSVGPLCHLILETIKKQATNSCPRMFLHCTHDETIIFLLQALDLFDDQWPPFNADIAFELLEEDGGQQWVRIVYCDRVLLELPLKEMEELISKVATNEEQHDALCKADP